MAIIVERKSRKHRPLQTGEMPMELKARVRDMGGSEVALILDNYRLDNFDVNKDQNRLLIPLGEIRGSFLTLEELRLLHSSSKAEIPVKLLEANWLTEKTAMYEDYGDTISLKRRCMSGSYLLTTRWDSVLARTRVREGTIVQLWSFRVGSQLCFALVSPCMLD